MIRSMTGYGEASAQIDGVHYFVEIRSLNNKYFKATIRLAEEYQGLEAEMESLLREKVSRGTVTLNARCSGASESAAYQVNLAALQKYTDRLRKLPQVAAGAISLCCWRSRSTSTSSPTRPVAPEAAALSSVASRP